VEQASEPALRQRKNELQASAVYVSLARSERHIPQGGSPGDLHFAQALKACPPSSRFLALFLRPQHTLWVITINTPRLRASTAPSPPISWPCG